MSGRSGRFYYKNEAEVMESLGMKQVPGSGNGWVAKEDGENEHVLCQLKSTDANSISVHKLDLDKLQVHAFTDKKIPVFAIQFLKSNEIYLLVRPEELQEVAEYLDTGIYSCEDTSGLRGLLDASDDGMETPRNVVKSSSSSRDKYLESIRQKYHREGKSAL